VYQHSAFLDGHLNLILLREKKFILLTAVIYSFFWEGITAAGTKKHIGYRDIIAVWIGAGITYLIIEQIDTKGESVTSRKSYKG